MRTRLFDLESAPVTVVWNYKRCSATEYSVVSASGSLSCVACPAGGNCTSPNAVDLVTKDRIVALPDWWASDGSDGSAFFKCPIPASCLSAAEALLGQRAVCAQGCVVLCARVQCLAPRGPLFLV